MSSLWALLSEWGPVSRIIFGSIRFSLPEESCQQDGFGNRIEITTSSWSTSALASCCGGTLAALGFLALFSGALQGAWQWYASFWRMQQQLGRPAPGLEGTDVAAVHVDARFLFCAPGIL